MAKFVCAGIVLLFVLSVTLPAAERPNVVLLMGDDHGWDETAYNGHPYLKTPVLDEMAATGLRLNRFYSGAPNCSPTRAGVMTGRHPNRCGTFNPGWSIRPEEVSVATLMKQAGYRCGHFGKWHLGPVKADSPTNPGKLGFDTWLSHDNFFELNPVMSKDGGLPQMIPGESSEILIDAAAEFIDGSVTDQHPFFVVVWFGSPHEPYSGLSEDLALYDDLPETFANKQVSLTSNETGGSTKRLQREVLRERFAEITAMDRAIGQLRDHLKQTGQRNNTLLWYCGDNGTSGDAAATVPFRGVKSTIYEGGLRVPGIIEWPAKIQKPRSSDISAVTSDILPTLCDVTGQPLPQRPLDGVSLKPMLDGTMTERPKSIGFWQWQAKIRPNAEPYFTAEQQSGTTPLVKLMGGKATRDFRNVRFTEFDDGDYVGPRALLNGRFKLVLDGNRKTPRELFDVIDDPKETKNLIDEHPETAKSMEAELHDWQTSVLQSLTGADY
ncbi:MAG: sulfatase-like hydrolase/transferase [Planctomycetaceae bacterium]|nr:sulfatase-like hydrolase/transferase [Planctomycetaceae bacterium]